MFENDTGIVTSPFYPRAYEASRTCLYEIIAPLGKAIVLNFVDFDLEDTSYPICDFDYVKIIDGPDANSTEIGKYCGVAMPPNVTSTLNNLILKFQSDSSISGRGFNATYSFVDVKCGGVIKSLGHEIKPPTQSYSSSYEHNSDCSWIIVAPAGSSVQLTFHSFSLEISTDCVLDSVTLYEGPISDGNKIQSYCGSSLPPVVQSSGNVLGIRFVSDYSVASDGFRAHYTFVDTSTGLDSSMLGYADMLPLNIFLYSLRRHILLSYRTLTFSRLIYCSKSFFFFSKISNDFNVNGYNSPIPIIGWPNDYSTYEDCTWVLNARTGQQIELRINSFELEERDDCDFDFFQIR